MAKLPRSIWILDGTKQGNWTTRIVAGFQQFQMTAKELYKCLEYCFSSPLKGNFLLYYQDETDHHIITLDPQSNDVVPYYNFTVVSNSTYIS
jgi:hypothetical protein